MMNSPPSFWVGGCRSNASIINLADQAGKTALHLAVSRGNHFATQQLLAAGADAQALDHNGSQPIHYAAYCGALDCVRALLEAGVPASVADRGAISVLHRAAGYAHKDSTNGGGALWIVPLGY